MNKIQLFLTLSILCDQEPRHLIKHFVFHLVLISIVISKSFLYWKINTMTITVNNLKISL